MSSKKAGRRLSAFLALVLMLSVVAPASAFADDVPNDEIVATPVPEVEVPEVTPDVEPTPEVTPEPTLEPTTEPVVTPDGTIDDGSVEEDADILDAGEDEAEAVTESVTVNSYESFMYCLQKLEVYADSFVEQYGGDPVLLVVNYIRTGVEKYTTDKWNVMAGAPNTDFINYVAEQDEVNKTNAGQALRSLPEFVLPNGNTADFAHMFGSLNMSLYNANNIDLGSWAGDICDLMEYSHNKGTSAAETEALTAEIREKYFLVDDPSAHSFGVIDLYGDLDSFYIYAAIKANSGANLSDIFAGYFTAALNDETRAAYFLNNRFSTSVFSSADDVRKVIFDTYSADLGCQTLEADRGISGESSLREACCNVFADWCYENGKDKLKGEVDPTPTPDPGPSPDPDPEEPDNKFYSVFSSTSSVLAPGIEQTINYAMTADDKQIVYYIASADVARDDVNIYANYHNAEPGSGWAMARVSDQMAALEAKHSDPTNEENYIENFKAIVGVNADFYNMSTGEPVGALVMNGHEYSPASNENFFGILKDGTPIIGSPSEYYANKDNIKEAVGGSVFLVKNGEIVVDSTADYYNSRASRTCVGITAEGKVILMVLDGRQEPFSAGGSAPEMAQIMYEAGCVAAINLDGGGSSTFDAKPEGSDSVVVVNRPSDGYERSVSSSLVIASTAFVSREFDHAVISAGSDYLTVGSSVSLTAVGVSTSGNAADIPENAVWQVSNPAIGSVTSEGVFTAAKTGSTDVMLVADGKTLGSKTLNVVVPDKLTFTKETISAIYGVSTGLPIAASYNGNPVAINPADIKFTLSSVSAGTIDGFAFTGDETSGIRSVTITAAIATDYSISAKLNVNLYKNGEAVFDFDSATSGDRSLAWRREVTNSTTSDDITYYIDDPNGVMDISYVFALDMKEIKFPDSLLPLLKMVAGGDISNVTAWDLLLQLAERVSGKTVVKIELDIDPSLKVDVSNINVSNDYFRLTSCTLDETTNHITVICNWVKQSQAIDPATANPICILSGIKAVAKEDAEWKDGLLAIINEGSVSYDVYLGANALYSMASQTNFQEQYGIYPYEEPENTTHPKGGHFYSSYASFKDEFNLYGKAREGWWSAGEALYYFVNNKPVTGINEVPGHEDPETKYWYRFDDNGDCIGKVTGLFEYDGNTYYAYKGQLKSGWRMITENGSDNYYYFNEKTFEAVDGEQTISSFHFLFVNKVLTRGDLVTNEKGTRYRWAMDWVRNRWIELDGNNYYADRDAYFATGFHNARVIGTNGGEVRTYLFDENGVWLKDVDGIYTHTDGYTYLVNNGVRVDSPGLVQIGDYYYYFTSNHYMIKNRDYWISKTNGLMPEKSYHFDEEGRMTNPEIADPAKNGIVKETETTWYYYVDGVKTYAGLIEIDGSYYYVKSNCEVIHNQKYWISKTNGLMPEGSYEFDEDGKMVLGSTPTPTPTPVPTTPVDPTPTPEVKNGIVAENGSLYYYVNGKLTYAGVIQIDGNYYYAKTSGEIVNGRKYWITKTNGLLKEKSYTFDETGKILDPDPVTPVDPTPVPTTPVDPTPTPEVKNGIVAENGSLYYYENGKLTYAGVIQIDGNYYYAKTSGEIVNGRKYWITKTNGLLKEKSYTFDETGKILDPDPVTPVDPTPVPTTPVDPTPTPEVKNGIVAENGSLYYYVDGKLTYAGLIKIDNDYYYVNSSCEVIHGKNYWISKTNGLLPEKSYTFADDGKIIL